MDPIDGTRELARVLLAGRGCGPSAAFPCAACEVGEGGAPGCMALARAALATYRALYGTPEAALAYALRDAEIALSRRDAEPPGAGAHSEALDERTIEEALPMLRLLRD